MLRFLLTSSTQASDSTGSTGSTSILGRFNSGLLIGVDLALTEPDVPGLFALATPLPAAARGPWVTFTLACGGEPTFGTTVVGALAGVATGFATAVPYYQQWVLKQYIQKLGKANCRNLELQIAVSN
jgi:hypothetical protein